MKVTELFENISGSAAAYKMVAKEHGWKQRGDHLHHPLHGTVTVNKHGGWIHKPRGSSEPDDGSEGTTENSLGRHFRELSIQHLLSAISTKRTEAKKLGTSKAADKLHAEIEELQVQVMALKQ